MSWFRWRKPPDQEPTVKEATDDRDRLFGELDDAIIEVDRARQKVINDYAEADDARTRRRR